MKNQIAETVLTKKNQEAGIALVTSMLITLVVLLLIGSLTFLLIKGSQTNVLNRRFTTVFDAANGGVEYSAGLIQSTLGGIPYTSTIGPISVTGGVTLADILNCTDTVNTATVTLQTADGLYNINSTIQCLGNKALPGYGGYLRFPPPPPVAGGGIGSTLSRYNFYSITSLATETVTPTNVGITESIYRVVQ